MSTDSRSTQPSLTPSNLLPTLEPHLAAFAQSLPALHHQLGLPQSALESDLASLRDALVKGIEDQLETRKREVSEWDGRCGKVEREVGILRAKVGAWGRNVTCGSVEENAVLPTRFSLLTVQYDKLFALHAAKLEQLSALSARLQTLTSSLSTDFFPQACLNIPPKAAVETAEREDVTPERFAHLEREYVRGKTEVSRRLAHLSQLFTDLLYLHTELILPFPSAPPEETTSPRLTASLSIVPNPISPSPISSDSPEAIFSRFIARLEEVETEGLELEGDLMGLEGVEPTRDVTEWAERLKDSLEELKISREAQIQQMYDQLEALWRRLGIPEEDIDKFVEENRGSGGDCVLAYEQELQRMLELKRSKMSLFVFNAREEIRVLWDDLMLGQDDREAFAPFFDDDHTEELLARHEDQIERLREEREGKAVILSSVRKWFEICGEQKELEAAASDGTRLLGKGRGDVGRLLKEEKMRKRVQKEKPKLEKELMSSAPAWEREHDRPLLVDGVRLIDLLVESMQAGEAEKENKRQRVKPSVPPRSTTPAPPGSRKRAATPSFTGTSSNKRQRVDSNAGSARPRSIASNNKVRPPLTSNTYETAGYVAEIPKASKALPSSTSAYSKLGHGIPPSLSGTFRLASNASVLSSRAASSMTELKIRESRQRESFRPRPSGVGLGMSLRAGGGGKWEGAAVKEEDEDD